MVHPGLGASGEILDLTTHKADLDEIAARCREIGPVVSYAEMTRS
jgi:hypothetical protein